MANQLGFYFDQQSCIGCFTCQISCKDKNGLEAGAYWRKVREFSGGSVEEKDGFFDSDVYAYWLSAACNHCENPRCAPNCPVRAIRKREEDGIVLVDQEKCIGCGKCVSSCPYGAVQLINNLAGKCNFCLDFLEAGKVPACVGACFLRALDYGPLEELRAKYGETADIRGLPSSGLTKPSLVLTPHKDAAK